MEMTLYSLIVFVVAAAVVSVKPLLLIMARLPDHIHISGWREKKMYMMFVVLKVFSFKPEDKSNSIWTGFPVRKECSTLYAAQLLSLIHISEPTRRA